MSRRPTLLMLAPYDETSASTRFRMLALVPYLRERGVDVQVSPFLDLRQARDFYDRGNGGRKVAALLRGALRQLMTAAARADAVFVQREAALLGPPIVEWLLGVARRLPLFLDIDDAVWLDASRSSRYPRLSRLLRNPEKSWFLMKRAIAIFSGSHHLARTAARVNPNVTVAPSVVSRTEWTPQRKRQDPRRLVMGWVGTHTTALQLELVSSALRRLRSERHEFDLRIVGAGGGFELPGAGAEMRPWTMERDVADFQDLDIGLAPMWDDEWGAGKCAFKQIQYMAVGVPFVSSFVGAAREIVVDGQNGLVATTADDWYRHLRELLVNHDLRTRLAANGRAHVERELCIEVQGPRLADIIADAVKRQSTDRSGGRECDEVRAAQ